MKCNDRINNRDTPALVYLSFNHTGIFFRSTTFKSGQEKCVNGVLQTPTCDIMCG